MDFEGAKAWLASFQFHGIKPGLFRIYTLLKRLGHPQKRFPSVHLAGTNGKGSTAAFLESILRHHGLKTGLYTSPHLICVTERFRINGAPIPKGRFAELCAALKNVLGDLPATYFELTTALAFLYFAEEGVDVAVIECGLGGRLDATNVLWPELSLITTIGYDHQAYLGERLSQIAWEKAGIIKRARPVAIGKNPLEALEVLKARARQLKAPFYIWGKDFWIKREEDGSFSYEGQQVFKALKPGLKGAFQGENLALALKGAELLVQKKGLSLEEETVKKAVAKTRWPGRFETFYLSKPIILDGAHNLDGIRVLLESLKEEGLFPFNLVFAASDEGHTKPYLAMLKVLLPLAEKVFICEAEGPRRPVRIEEWQRELKGEALEKIFYVRQAQEAFLAALKEKGPVLVTGSLYLVGNIRQILLGETGC